MTVALLVVSVTVLGLGRLLAAHSDLLRGLEAWCAGEPMLYVDRADDADERACGVAARLVAEEPEPEEASSSEGDVNAVAYVTVARTFVPPTATAVVAVTPLPPPEPPGGERRGRARNPARVVRGRRRRRPGAARRDAGYTMVDVLVAAVLVGIFASVVVGAARFVGVATSSLRLRARAVGELRMATEYLRQDLGGATAVTRTDDGALLVTREETVARLAGGWVDGADAGVAYALDGGRLVRRDVATGTEVVAAVAVSDFDVTNPAVDETAVRVAAGTGAEERAVTIVWRSQ